MADRRPLKPARPDTPEAAAYMPRIPWRNLFLIVLFVATVTVGYQLKERNKADNLRAQIMQVHEEQLEPARQRYEEFRGSLEKLILEAGAEDTAKTFVDPRLNLSGLRKGQGLYLRLPRSSASDVKAIAKAAATMEADSIPRCLGLSVSSARGLYEQGAFLSEDWAEQTREQEGVMNLRVSDEVLARHIEADLPSVLGLLKSNWFMLVLQSGENRSEAPVDVYLWDLSSKELLLSAQVQARAALLGARIALGDAPRSYGTVEEQGGTAADCSIASQLKALSGGALLQVEHSALPGQNRADAGVAEGTEETAAHSAASGEEARP